MVKLFSFNSNHWNWGWNVSKRCHSGDARSPSWKHRHEPSRVLLSLLVDQIQRKVKVYRWVWFRGLQRSTRVRCCNSFKGGMCYSKCHPLARIRSRLVSLFWGAVMCFPSLYQDSKATCVIHFSYIKCSGGSWVITPIAGAIMYVPSLTYFM